MKLPDQQLDIWLIRAGDASLCWDCCKNVLSAAEQERAARFKFQTDSKAYTIAHAALRSILASYLRDNPTELAFSFGSSGKPALERPAHSKSVEFNLSHSGDVALVAVTEDREIGVDVEYVKKDFPIHEVAQRFFTANEVAALNKLPSHLQRLAFFKCWTSKEAYLKAKGTGLSGKLDEVEIVVTPDGRVRINGRVPKWSLTELELDQEYAAAVVVEGGESSIRYRRWRGPAADCAHRPS